MFGNYNSLTYLCKQIPNIFQIHTKKMSALTENFKRRRIEMGMTQKQLAKVAGCGLNAVINWEAGRNVRPSTVSKLLSVLGMNYQQPKSAKYDDTDNE